MSCTPRPRGLTTAVGSIAVRAGLAYLFVDAGRKVFGRPEGAAVAAARVTDRIKRVAPMLGQVPTTTFVRLNAVTHVVAGAGLLVRRVAPVSAMALAVSLVPTSVAAFPFWSVSEQPQRTHAKNDFTKNLGLIAGLLGAATLAYTQETQS